MSSTPVVRPSYAAVLRIPYARRTFAAALLGRLSYGIVPLSVMLAVTRASGSYAVAGVVMALFSGTSVFLSPARAALIDRHGPRRALVPMAAAYTALLGLLTVTVWHPGAASPLVLGTVTAAAGACTPPLGPTMRALWGRLAADRALVQRAYSLDAVAEELLFVSGPLLVGVVVGFAPPALGIVVGAVLIAAGTAGFVASPPVRDLAPGHAKARARGKSRRRVLRGIGRPVIAAAGVGLALGAVELLVVAFVEGRGHGSDSVAWVLAAMSAGSAVGGLANGAFAWRISAGLRLPLLAAGLGTALLGAGLAPGLGTLASAMAVAGLFVAPAITTAYLIADEAAAPEARVQAGAWVNTAVNAGGTAGTAAAGLLVGRLSTGWCFAVTGAVTLLAAVAVARGATRDRGAPEEDTVGEVGDGGAVRAA
ncbi:MFS transporter [Streptomyces sp. DT2A-34]|uniref:MFS transporter n=1 Tax=Streptomyces sp. DT2A-34 TaxID=3051182 RepID=UPI00265BE3CE|nr:MFS transporter [Streptomyces sp. DT2A-34]MDO0911696.1 MFS transporter [Streptomyces sp. DT2A-34]